MRKILITLSGNSLDEIQIEFTGIRPGEKLFEELLKKEEMHEQQIHPKIYIGKTSNLYIKEIEEVHSNLYRILRNRIKKTVLTLANNRIAPQNIV